MFISEGSLSIPQTGNQVPGVSATRLSTVERAQNIHDTLIFLAEGVIKQLSSPEITHGERRNILSHLNDQELAAVNNFLFLKVSGSNVITSNERMIFLALSQTRSTRKNIGMEGESLKVSHAEGISRYIQERGRVEISSGWTRIERWSVHEEEVSV